MQAQQPQPNLPPRPDRPSLLQNTSLGRRLNVGLWFADLAALSVLVFLRRQIGYRTIELGKMIFLFFFLVFCMDWIVALPNWIGLTVFKGKQGTEPLAYLALPMLILAIFHRFRHWRQIKRAELTWMTTSRGVSHFEFLPISPNIVYRFVDFAVCLIAGFLINVFLDMVLLGDWIMFSAVMFLIVEQQHYNAQLNHSLDMLDSMIAAKAQARLVQYYSRETQEIRLSRSETAGLPTGIGRDVERLIAQRYATAAAAGSLAPSATISSPAELAAAAAERGALLTPPTIAAPDNLAGPGRA